MTSRDFFIKQAKQAHNIVEFLRGELKFAGFSHADIKKTPLGTRITIYAVRPGLVIGSGGENIKRITRTIEHKFKVENPHVEVEQIDDIFLDPHIVAWRIAKSLEKGGNFKRIASIMIQRIIQSGARGVEIRLSGKLPSKRAKCWKFTAGNPRKCGQEVIDHAKVGYEIAIQKLGVIGVRVMIIPPHVKFSDEIHFIEIEEKVEKVKGGVEKKEEKVEVAPKKELEKEIDKKAPMEIAEGAEVSIKEVPVEAAKVEDTSKVEEKPKLVEKASEAPVEEKPEIVEKSVEESPKSEEKAVPEKKTEEN